MMQVEIGIPSYNNGPYLAEAINHCLKQNYPHIKVLVADDGSSDDTINRMQEFARNPNVLFFQNERNLGRVQNYRHILYDLADGDWYVNLDGDDYFSDPGFIAHAMQLIEQQGAEHLAFYQGNHNVAALKKIFPDGVWLNDEEVLIPGQEYFLKFPKLRRNTHCATVYSRKKALPLSFYSFDCLFADFHSLSRLALTGNVILSAKLVATWRQHESNASKTLNENQLRREIASLDEVALFAASYLDATQVTKWLKQMKSYYRLVFIYHSSTYTPGWQSIRFILRNWRFDWYYPRYMLKNLWLMFRK